MRRLAMLALVVTIGGCSGPGSQTDVDEPGKVDKGKGQIKGPPPWEIVWVRSITVDPGDCQNLERMDTEVHVAAQGINIYASHYTGSQAEVAKAELSTSAVKKKLVGTHGPETEPARTLIEEIEKHRYYDYVGHATYALESDPPEGCSDEAQSITILMPGSTSIINFEHGTDAGPAEGMVRDLYDLLKEKL